MSRKMSLSQKRAISYAITKRENEKAVKVLREQYGIDFEPFCKVTGWKASANKLENSIEHGSISAAVLKKAGLRKTVTEIQRVSPYTGESWIDKVHGVEPLPVYIEE